MVWPTQRSGARAAPSRPHTRQPLTRPPPKPLPLWRFFVAAAVIVVTIGSVLVARRGAAPDLKISARVIGTPTPTAQRAEARATPAARPTFLGSGSWAMSSLPACFIERERLRGPTVRLQPSFPPAAQRVPAGSVVHAGNCTLVVGRRDLLIVRGNDRLRVPPEAALYRDANGMTLVWVDGTHAEIRRYDMAELPHKV